MPGTAISNTTAGRQSREHSCQQWYNSYQNRWDALISNATGSGEDDELIKDITGTPFFTGQEYDTRATSTPDCIWDDANKTLYIYSAHATDPKFWRVTYNSGTDTYTKTVDNVSIPGLDKARGSMHVSPNGYIWCAVAASTGLRVNRSTDGGTTWNATDVQIVASAIGASDWFGFSYLGTNYVGLFCAENAAAAAYCYIISESADFTNLANWTDESSSIPSPGWANYADDHCCATSYNNTSYIVIKTEGGEATSTNPLVWLMVRTAAGSWSGIKVWDHTGGFTRACIAIDATNENILVAANQGTGARPTKYKIAPLASPSDLTTATAVDLFTDGTAAFQDTLAPAQLCTSASGILFLAQPASGSTNIWQSHLTITAAGVGIPIAAYHYNHHLGSMAG